MNKQWKKLVESWSASIDERDIVTLPNATPFPECALSDLSSMGMIRVSGEDAADFLQGQLSNDIHAVSEEQSQISCYCTPQGRMLASFRIFMRDGDFYLQFPQELLAITLKRLSMFVLISKVKLEDVSDQLVRIGISGSCAAELLSTQLDSVPSGDNGVTHTEDITLLRLPADRPRFELIGPVEQIAPLWQQLNAKAEIAGADLWPLLDIRAGVATIYSDNVEAFVPQMTNMQLVDGVSFTKGCYVGQEIVARMKYLGQLKRRMYRSHVAADISPQPGDELFSPQDDGSDQSVGRVVDARPSPDGGYELLVVITAVAYSENSLHLKEITGPQLNFLDLPYTFDPE